MPISKKDLFNDMFSLKTADKIFVTVEDAEKYIETANKQKNFSGTWDALTYRLAQVKCGIPLE